MTAAIVAHLPGAPAHHKLGAAVLVLAHLRRGQPAQFQPATVVGLTPISLRPGCSTYRVTVAGRDSATGLRWDLCPPEWVIPDALEGATA